MANDDSMSSISRVYNENVSLLSQDCCISPSPTQCMRWLYWKGIRDAYRHYAQLLPPSSSPTHPSMPPLQHLLPPLYKAAKTPTNPKTSPAPWTCTAGGAAPLVVAAAALEVVPDAPDAMVEVMASDAPLDMDMVADMEPEAMEEDAEPVAAAVEAAVEAQVAVVGRAEASPSEPQMALANWIVAVNKEEEG